MRQCSECCTECSKKGCTNNIKDNVYFNANSVLMMLAVESANNRCVSSEMCVSCDEARMKYLRA